MRILVSGNGANVLGDYLQNEVVEPLRFLGHEVLVVELTETKVQKALHRFFPDILVVIPSNEVITGARIRALTAETETIAICLHPGGRYSGTSTSLNDLEEDLREYDFVFVPEEAVRVPSEPHSPLKAFASMICRYKPQFKSLDDGTKLSLSKFPEISYPS